MAEKPKGYVELASLYQTVKYYEGMMDSEKFKHFLEILTDHKYMFYNAADFSMCQKNGIEVRLNSSIANKRVAPIQIPQGCEIQYYTSEKFCIFGDRIGSGIWIVGLDRQRFFLDGVFLQVIADDKKSNFDVYYLDYEKDIIKLTKFYLSNSRGTIAYNQEVYSTQKLSYENNYQKFCRNLMVRVHVKGQDTYLMFKKPKDPTIWTIIINFISGKVKYRHFDYSNDVVYSIQQNNTKIDVTFNNGEVDKSLLKIMIEGNTHINKKSIVIKGIRDPMTDLIYVSFMNGWVIVVYKVDEEMRNLLLFVNNVETQTDLFLETFKRA